MLQDTCSEALSEEYSAVTLPGAFSVLATVAVEELGVGETPVADAVPGSS